MHWALWEVGCVSVFVCYISIGCGSCDFIALNVVRYTGYGVGERREVFSLEVLLASMLMSFRLGGSLIMLCYWG